MITKKPSNDARYIVAALFASQAEANAIGSFTPGELADIGKKKEQNFLDGYKQSSDKPAKK